MADVFSILSANYKTLGAMGVPSKTKYVNVDPTRFEGTWSGKYANNKPFTITVTDVNGFRAKVKYQYGNELKYQEVLIKDDSFRIADTKFFVKRDGVAEIRSVMVDPATGASTLETAFANQG